MTEQEVEKLKAGVNKRLKEFASNIVLIQPNTPSAGNTLILLGEICGLIAKVSELEIMYCGTTQVRNEMSEINKIANEAVMKLRPQMDE